MNKVELVNQMVEQTGLKKKDVEAVLASFIDTVTNTLAKGEKVQLIGFGTFETRERAARTGRNPQTGKEIKIPAARVPAFKTGAKLKEAVK